MPGIESPLGAPGMMEEPAIAIDLADVTSRQAEEARRAGAIAIELRTLNPILPDSTVDSRAFKIAVLEVWSDALGNRRG